MAGIDNFTKLLLHCNGTDGSTDFPDSSYSEHTVTAVGNAQVDTAQKKFGTGSALFDGSGDYLNVPDSTDWDLGTDDFTIDFWVRFNSLAGGQGFCSRYTDGSSYFYFAMEVGLIRLRDYVGGDVIDLQFGTPSLSTDTWYHFAVVRNGNNFKFFIDGIQFGSTLTSSSAFINRSDELRVGAFGGFYYMNGWIDEFRFSNGIARWTSNFTPPTEEYTENKAEINETVTIDDSWHVQPNPDTISFEETIEIGDSWFINRDAEADYATSVISINPLIIVTDTDPAKIVSVDITDPTNPIETSLDIIGVKNAQDVSYNATTGFLYIACADGKVVKIDINDLDDQTIINLNDTDDLQTIDCFDDESITFTSTDNSDGELYMIDERVTALLDTNFQYLQENIFTIQNQFNFIEGFLLDSNFQYLETVKTLLNTDFKWLEDTQENIVPYQQTDFHVYIDDVELGNTDLVLDSIQITHTINEQSQATFNLARNHDNINSPLDGGTVTITNQNDVKIYIGTNLEFHGKVSNISCIYSPAQEIIQVNALMNQPNDQRQQVTLSLPSNDSPLGLYNVLVQNPVIYNPYIDPNDEEPVQFKGVRVDLGTRITQSISRYRIIETISGGKGKIAESIEDGSFEILQNWVYFWFARARNFITNREWTISRYIGTSLSSLTSDTWELIGTPYYRQRQHVDTEVDLGEYTVGSAPYLDVSVQNGELKAVDRWADKTDGIYREKDESYNYVGDVQLVGGSYQTIVKGYAQTVADLEYSKLLNINGTILPQTSADMTVTIDTYYYYTLKLLTRINVDNTTSAGIFENSNGFPVSIKSITISSRDMRIRLRTDNSLSLVELKEIDDEYPDPESDEYLFPAESVRQSRKYDPNRGVFVD